MLYKMEIGDREIYLAQKALTDDGDYIVYEWNDGLYISEDDDDDEFEIDDEMEEDLFPLDFDEEDGADDETYEVEDDEEEECGEFEDEYIEDDKERNVRLDIEAILSSGFVPQGGVSTYITPKYTTVYAQAFYRKK